MPISVCTYWVRFRNCLSGDEQVHTRQEEPTAFPVGVRERKRTRARHEALPHSPLDVGHTSIWGRRSTSSGAVCG
ncbi:hypothetical protein GW17_00041977 [Ensete ventricosum]|nr:hypothetical protein GW17_00041977 [Ensete ventricosum]RZS18921.1 hypothetical protein BHM03_00051254 [Ensete ventricosum]